MPTYFEACGGLQ